MTNLLEKKLLIILSHLVINNQKRLEWFFMTKGEKFIKIKMNYTPNKYILKLF
jgi:hypothetical protein